MGLFSIFLVGAAATRRGGTLLKAHTRFQAVAQIVGVGLERSKILDLSMRID
jgi:hypothetical protein